MRTEKVPIVSFLNEVMRRHKRLPGQLADDLGISRATVSRWLSAQSVPSTESCHKLAEYSGVPLEHVLALHDWTFAYVGHLSKMAEISTPEWPEFREYARQRYPDELDEDLITMIEDLIERRRQKRYNANKHP